MSISQDALRYKNRTQLALLADICKVAYLYTSTTQLESFNVGASKNPRLVESFRLIQHYIGRLSYTIEAVEGVLIAGWKLPRFFFENTSVLRLMSAPYMSPIFDEGINIYQVFDRMFDTNHDPLDLKNLHQFLKNLVTKYRPSLNTKLRSIQRSMIKNPKVHAELILLERFQSGDFKFLNEDW